MLIKFDSILRIHLSSPRGDSVKFVIFKTQIFYELCTSGYIAEKIFSLGWMSIKGKREKIFSLLIENEDIVLRLFLTLVMYRYCT